MYSYKTYFQQADRLTVVVLQHPINNFLSDWDGVRARLLSQVPENFTRDEWAYIIQFLSFNNLRRIFCGAFGEPTAVKQQQVRTLVKPRGTIAVWLPNNVSLLGPLSVVLLSLTGNKLILKGGSSGKDLTQTFLEAVKECATGHLKQYLEESVDYQVFARHDVRTNEMAALADVRLVFGSDQAAQTIHSLPQPLGSTGFSFINRKSEAWIEKLAITNDVIESLIKVFAVYGQAGCTSPARVFLVNGEKDDALRLQKNLVELWPKIIKTSPPMHVASNNIMMCQLLKMDGWEAQMTQKMAAVFEVGDVTKRRINNHSGLPIVYGTLDQAVSTMPENIQTIGYAVEKPVSQAWLDIIGKTKIKRFVPIIQMHNFGEIWDGAEFWRQCFEYVEVA